MSYAPLFLARIWHSDLGRAAAHYLKTPRSHNAATMHHADSTSRQSLPEIFIWSESTIVAQLSVAANSKYALMAISIGCSELVPGEGLEPPRCRGVNAMP